MRKAIAILSFVVLCSFSFVALSLAARRPARVGVPSGPPAILQTQPDGSVYAVSLQLSKFERRLMEEEKLSERLQNELNAVRQSRDDLADQVDELLGELRRLKRQVAESQRPAPHPVPTPAPANSPSVVPPAGVNGPTDGTTPVPR